MTEEITKPVFYVNAVRFFSSQNDFSFDMMQAQASIEDDQNIKAIQVPLCKVFMSPQHFKQFILIGKSQLDAYESEFGEIKLKPKVLSENGGE